MKVVLDASAAVATVVEQPSAPAILEVLARASVVVAPQLYACEVTSSLWKYIIAKQMTVSDAAERLDAVLKLVDRYHPEAELAQEVLRESSARQHSPYDLFYLVLARREGAAILTLDARLRKVARAMGITVHP